MQHCNTDSRTRVGEESVAFPLVLGQARRISIAERSDNDRRAVATLDVGEVPTAHVPDPDDAQADGRRGRSKWRLRGSGVGAAGRARAGASRDRGAGRGGQGAQLGSHGAEPPRRHRWHIAVITTHSLG